MKEWTWSWLILVDERIWLEKISWPHTLVDQNQCCVWVSRARHIGSVLSEHEDLVMIGEHVLHEEVDGSNGIQGHLASPWPHQIRPKNNRQVTGCHLVQVTAIHYLRRSCQFSDKRYYDQEFLLDSRYSFTMKK